MANFCGNDWHMNLPFHSIKSPVDLVNDDLLLNNPTDKYELYREYELSSITQVHRLNGLNDKAYLSKLEYRLTK